MRFPKTIQNKKTKAEVTIYGKSKGGEQKQDGGVTQPYPFYRICWRVAGQRRETRVDARVNHKLNGNQTNDGAESSNT